MLVHLHMYLPRHVQVRMYLHVPVRMYLRCDVVRGERNCEAQPLRVLLLGESIKLDIHDAGLAPAERYGLSIYDAMIAASALHAECDTRWSEDMHDDLPIQDQLPVANPFRSG